MTTMATLGFWDKWPLSYHVFGFELSPAECGGIKILYSDLHTLPAPRGFAASAEDLDILVYQYADNIMGLANSYLDGQKIESANVHIDKELDLRLEECLAKLNELKIHKQKFDALARYLIDDLSKDGGS